MAMTFKEIYEGIEDLSKSQGLYGRLLEYINKLEANDIDKYHSVVEQLESYEFKDMVDFIIWMEG